MTGKGAKCVGVLEKMYGSLYRVLYTVCELCTVQYVHVEVFVQFVQPLLIDIYSNVYMFRAHF